jgi:thiosulfate reductase cytochrome b subunit
LLTLWFALDPASFYAWVNNAISTLQIRYNLFELAKDMRLRLGGELKAPLWQRPEYALYLAWILAVGWLLWRNWRAGTSPLLAGSLLVLAVPAAGPANLSYSWVVAVPLVYMAVMQAEGPWRWIIAALAIMPPPLVGLLMHVHVQAMLPLLAVMLAFLVIALQTPHRRLSLQTID